MIELSEQHIRDLYTGAIFTACMINPDWAHEQMDRVLIQLREGGSRLQLCSPEDLEPDGLVVAVGYVSNGLPPSDLRPVGDEFARSLRILQDALDRPIAGVMPLAAGGLNAMVPPLAAMQFGVPIVDADPMGRVFPLVNQTVFTLAKLPAGPIAAAGATGEVAFLQVEEPVRVDRLLRALAGVYGGWAATASYPMSAETLARYGVSKSLSRLLAIGSILGSDEDSDAKYEALRRNVGVKLSLRARVSDLAWFARGTLPGQTARPSSIALVEEANGRIVQLMVQNEVVILLVDGAIRASVPDIITMLHAHDGSPATIEDLWVGNMVDIVVMHADAAWYSPEGIELAGPKAFGGLGLDV
ncbi:MAG: DUF917 domain-containing protein [Actinobacteria bacterium]|nr:DUF917 domain-containing protein [Actinomycetota bacterium]